MSDRKAKVAEAIDQKTKDMLKQLPEGFVLHNPPVKLRKTPDELQIGKKELLKRYEEDSDFAAEIVGNVTATVLESAIRQSKKEKEAPTG